MALQPVPVSPYPNVPRQPGVPSVFRQAGAVENTVVQVVADAAQVLQQFGLFTPQWGVFDGKTGQPIFTADSVVSIDYRNEWQIASHPIEEGAFRNYNKVKTPFDVRVVFAIAGNSLLNSLIPGGAALSLITGGTSATRKAALTALDAKIATVDMVTVITPEATYPNVNIIHYDYRRDARSGATVIHVEVWLQEVRVSAKAALSKDGKITGTDDPSQSPQNQNQPSPGDGGTGGGGANQNAPPGTGGDQAGGSPGVTNAKAPEGARPVDGGTAQTPGVGKGGTASTGLGPGGEPAGVSLPGARPQINIGAPANSPVPPGSEPVYRGPDGAYVGSGPAPAPATVTIGPDGLPVGVR